MKRSLPLLALLALLTACGASASPGGTGGSGATTTTTTTSTGTGPIAGPDITGSVVERYYGEGAPVDAPVDLTKLAVRAYVQENGAWQTYSGNGTAQGTFTIPGVPEGDFMVGVAGRYVLGSARSLDLGADVLGRPGAAQAGTNTTIAGEIQGLSTWQKGDAFEFVNVNGGGAAYLFRGFGPNAGDTALMGQSMPWAGGLIDASKGDTLYAAQLAQGTTAGGTTYVNVAGFLTLTGVKQPDKVQTTVSGTLTPVNADLSVSLDLDTQSFISAAAVVDPTTTEAVVDVFTLPGAAAGGLGATVDLLRFSLSSGDAMQVGPLPYGNPFPSTWSTSLYAAAAYALPVTGLNGYLYGAVYVRMPLADAAAALITPVVTPVLGLTINGKSATTDLMYAGKTPTFAWMPPTTGPATGYQIVAYEDSSDKQVAVIATTATTVTFPPGVLQAGHVYGFVVTAISASGNTPAAPLRGGPTYAGADVLTASVMP
jgi:hypothetical protein